MNVVVVNDFAFVNGGAAQVALAGAKGLADRGHRVTLFSAVLPPGGPAPNDARLQVVATGQQEIARDPNRLRAAVQGLWNARARAAMRRLLHSFDPQDTVVHFHGWSKALSSSVIREALARRFESVLTLHDYFAACPNGGFFNYRTQAKCSLRPLSAACIAANCDARSYPQKLWRVARQVVQQRAGGFPQGMRHFIAVSEFSAALLGPHLPAAARIHRVANPIDVPLAPRVPTRREAGFVCIGRLSPEKGPLLLARAARGLDVPVTFVGEGALREAVSAAHPAAVLTGWLPPAAVRARLQGALALVFPSLCYETQGLAVAEAAALGVAAVVPDRSAALEAVEDGVTGLVFRSGDEADLRCQLRRLQARPDLAEALGAAAYERFWSSPPTLQRHVERLEAVYAQMLLPAGRPAPSSLTLETSR